VRKRGGFPVARGERGGPGGEGSDGRATLHRRTGEQGLPTCGASAIVPGSYELKARKI
jgi:hypothetical protein